MWVNTETNGRIKAQSKSEMMNVTYIGQQVSILHAPKFLSVEIDKMCFSWIPGMLLNNIRAPDRGLFIIVVSCFLPSYLFEIKIICSALHRLFLHRSCGPRPPWGRLALMDSSPPTSSTKQSTSENPFLSPVRSSLGYHSIWCGILDSHFCPFPLNSRLQ